MITAHSPSSITVLDGYNATTNITLFCTSSGSPPDTFTWIKDDDPTVLQSNNITTVTHTNTNAVFRSDYTINISDNGTFTCTVTNPIGSDNYSITVIFCKLLCIFTVFFALTLGQRHLSEI